MKKLTTLFLCVLFTLLVACTKKAGDTIINTQKIELNHYYGDYSGYYGVCHKNDYISDSYVLMLTDSVIIHDDGTIDGPGRVFTIYLTSKLTRRDSTFVLPNLDGTPLRNIHRGTGYGLYDSCEVVKYTDGIPTFDETEYDISIHRLDNSDNYTIILSEKTYQRNEKPKHCYIYHGKINLADRRSPESYYSLETKTPVTYNIGDGNGLKTTINKINSKESLPDSCILTYYHIFLTYDYNTTHDYALCLCLFPKNGTIINNNYIVNNTKKDGTVWASSGYDNFNYSPYGIFGLYNRKDKYYCKSLYFVVDGNLSVERDSLDNNIILNGSLTTYYGTTINLKSIKFSNTQQIQ